MVTRSSRTPRRSSRSSPPPADPVLRRGGGVVALDPSTEPRAPCDRQDGYEAGSSRGGRDGGDPPDGRIPRPRPGDESATGRPGRVRVAHRAADIAPAEDRPRDPRERGGRV